MFATFLSSGLFLGWSLGANDASNVFGTAVGSRMIRFRTAAICCSIFIVIGAVISGAGASHTLGRLGAVNTIAGAFIVALAAAMSVYLMTLARFPVSTSQAIVGAIIGWNLFSGALTDGNSLIKIVSTWVLCPVLSALIAMVLYKMVAFLIGGLKPHMFKLDSMTRSGLLLAGIFGSYSLGANNIANVMGVFIPVSPFSSINIFGMFNLTSAQQLFFIGGIAIALGVFTYSKRVMMTVGEGIMELSPVAAFVAVWSHSIVLFLFSSQGLEAFLARYGLPVIPLVPVSSSQAIVGAVIGMGLLKGGRGIRWRTVGGIASGWVTTPIIAVIMSFISLFFLQNVFQQKVYRAVPYALTSEAAAYLNKAGVSTQKLDELLGKEFSTAVQFKKALSQRMTLTDNLLDSIMNATEIAEIAVMEPSIAKIDTAWFSREQIDALQQLSGQRFIHTWQLRESLAELSPHWQFQQKNKAANKELHAKLTYLYKIFRLHKGY